MAADAFLCQVKEILDGALKEEEFFCRQGADIFYLAFENDTPAHISQRVSKISADIQRESGEILEEYPILIYSGGVLTAESPEPYSMSNLSYMMAALAQARKLQCQEVCFYDQSLHASEHLRHYIESHMQAALEQEEFQLYLQPKMNLHTGRLEGAEALVRWQTQDRGMLYPDQFIPLFEENGFCAQLDLYMVEQACRQIRSWLDRDIDPIPISVNQSRLLFYEADYPERLKELVDRYEIPAGLITLEILEGLAIGNVKEMNERISLLHKAGFRISMDDFGAGYSSLNVMGALKIDELKLDRAFLMEVSQGNNLRQKAVMEMVIALTRRLRIATVAEGVETKEDEALIRELGCDAGQGYYYSRPVSAEEFDGRFIGAGL